MTEAGEQWAWDMIGKSHLSEITSIAMERYESAEFWLRAFCVEVERRAKDIKNSRSCLGDDCFSPPEWEAFEEVKCELLGI